MHNTVGAALKGMTVRAYRGGSVTSEITTTTAADGSYAFTGLQVGAGTLYSLRFSNGGDYLPLDYDPDPSTIFNPEAVKVIAGKTTTADAVMRRSCTPFDDMASTVKLKSPAPAEVVALPSGNPVTGSSASTRIPPRGL